LREGPGRHNFARMNLTKERSRGEIILFATVIFGVWLSIWAVILTSATLGAAALFFMLVPLLLFALSNNE
jgi:hypothetical protein